jgi:hypothetical protein
LRSSARAAARATVLAAAGGAGRGRGAGAGGGGGRAAGPPRPPAAGRGGPRPRGGGGGGRGAGGRRRRRGGPPRPAAALAELAGETLYAGAGNPETTEWTDYARGLFAGRDIRLAGPFPKIQGDAEFVRVVRKRGWSVLASEEFTAVPGMVLCPLTEPVPLSPVSLVWRRGLRHRGLDALIGAAGSLGAAHGWLDRPPDGWLPEADRALLAQTG